MRVPLLTHEIGSLAKPNWRVKAFKNQELTEEDIQDAKTWCRILEPKEGCDELIRLLSKRRGFTPEEKEKILYFSSLLATRLLEKAGLDLVYDGEQHRIEMYEYPIRRIKGFRFLGHVRSFDNRYYNVASCYAPPLLKEYYHLEEFRRISSFATKPVKIPITGPYTLMDWSFDEYYMKGIEMGSEDFLRKRRAARKNLLMDLAERVVYPNLKALADLGARYLQIDEPAATTKAHEVPLFIEGVIHSIKDLKDRVFFGIHICFSNYYLLFPHLSRLQGIVDELHFEYSNRDSRKLGRTDKERIGYDILIELAKYDFVVGLGVIDVHTDFIEPPELVRDRILYAVDLVGSPERIYVAPDCGLRTRTWKVAYEKLSNLVEGRNLAMKELRI